MARSRSVVLQSPTGSGKTVLTAHMMATAAQKGMGAWFLVHRKELLDQTSDALWENDVPHGVIMGKRTRTRDIVQVASVQTLARRLDSGLTPPNLIIIDEAHHAAARSYRAILEAYPKAYVVGLTATPKRTDGRGLDDLFNELVLGPSVSFLMERGYLSPYRLVAPPSSLNLEGVHRRAGDFARGELSAAVERSTIMGDAVEHYQKFVQSRSNGRPPTCLVYCVSRQHAHHVEEAYRAAGIDAAYCAADLSRGRRNAIVAGFRTGRPAVIVSVDLFGEGLDVPGLSAVQLLRPTESLTLHLQQIGRALRVEKGKEYAMILDHVGNTWRHGLPDDEREWTLEGRKKRARKGQDTAPGIRLCDNCFAVYRVTLPACPICGSAPAKAARRGPDHVDGELVEIDAKEHRRHRAYEEHIAAEQGLEALVRLAMARNYKASWAGIRHAKTSKGRVTVEKAVRAARTLWREIKAAER